MKCKYCDKPATIDFFGFHLCKECSEKPAEFSGVCEMLVRFCVAMACFGVLVWFLAHVACGH